MHKLSPKNLSDKFAVPSTLFNSSLLTSPKRSFDTLNFKLEMLANTMNNCNIKTVPAQFFKLKCISAYKICRNSNLQVKHREHTFSSKITKWVKE